MRAYLKSEFSAEFAHSQPFRAIRADLTRRESGSLGKTSCPAPAVKLGQGKGHRSRYSEQKVRTSATSRYFASAPH